MKCLTFFLMLPESVKSKSSKSSKKGNASGGSKLPPVCYEIITLRSKKKKKMAADIFPTKKPASTTTVQQYQQQNLNNNNTIQNCNWQGLYSTIRERYVQLANLNGEIHPFCVRWLLLHASLHVCVGVPSALPLICWRYLCLHPLLLQQPLLLWHNRERTGTGCVWYAQQAGLALH